MLSKDDDDIINNSRKKLGERKREKEREEENITNITYKYIEFHSSLMIFLLGNSKY